MPAKCTTKVEINGKAYILSGYEEEEYLQEVAAYINQKIEEFNKATGYRRIPPEMRPTLIQLNIADDYYKAKKRMEELEKEVDSLRRELYTLKLDLISAQLDSDTSKHQLDKLREENKELLLAKTRLESMRNKK